MIHRFVVLKQYFFLNTQLSSNFLGSAAFENGVKAKEKLHSPVYHPYFMLSCHGHTAPGASDNSSPDWTLKDVSFICTWHFKHAREQKTLPIWQHPHILSALLHWFKKKKNVCGQFAASKKDRFITLLWWSYGAVTSKPSCYMSLMSGKEKMTFFTWH